MKYRNDHGPSVRLRFAKPNDSLQGHPPGCRIFSALLGASLAEFQELELFVLGVIASSDVAGVRTMMFT
jgi:hypothetical protein